MQTGTLLIGAAAATALVSGVALTTRAAMTTRAKTRTCCAIRQPVLRTGVGLCNSQQDYTAPARVDFLTVPAKKRLIIETIGLAGVTDGAHVEKLFAAQLELWQGDELHWTLPLATTDLGYVDQARFYRLGSSLGGAFAATHNVRVYVESSTRVSFTAWSKYELAVRASISGHYENIG